MGFHDVVLNFNIKFFTFFVFLLGFQSCRDVLWLRGRRHGRSSQPRGGFRPTVLPVQRASGLKPGPCCCRGHHSYSTWNRVSILIVLLHHLLKVFSSCLTNYIKIRFWILIMIKVFYFRRYICQQFLKDEDNIFKVARKLLMK